MEPSKVPQNLELEDVLAWSMTAADLLWLGGGLTAAWWIYLHLPAPMPLRIAVAVPPALVAGLLGPSRVGGRPLRKLASELLAFCSRPRRRIYRGGR